jgi:hypothetical protein
VSERPVDTKKNQEVSGRGKAPEPAPATQYQPPDSQAPTTEYQPPDSARQALAAVQTPEATNSRRPQAVDSASDKPIMPTRKISVQEDIEDAKEGQTFEEVYDVGDNVRRI